MTGHTRYLTPSQLLRIDRGLSARDRGIVRSVEQLRLVSGGQLGRLVVADASPSLPGQPGTIGAPRA